MNRKKLIILVIISIIIMLIVYLYSLLNNNNKKRDTTIVGIKIENQDNNQKSIKYEIRIKNYNIETVKKIVKMQDKDLAQLEYDRYNIIKEYENKDLEIEIKGKKVVIDVPEDVFLEEIGYDSKRNITYISDDGEKEIINQNAIKELLREQGYTI